MLFNILITIFCVNIPLVIAFAVLGSLAGREWFGKNTTGEIIIMVIFEVMSIALGLAISLPVVMS